MKNSKSHGPNLLGPQAMKKYMVHNFLRRCNLGDNLDETIDLEKGISHQTKDKGKNIYGWKRKNHKTQTIILKRDRCVVIYEAFDE